MKKYNNIDDLFREEISGFTVKPSEALLKDIEAARLAEKRSGRKAIYLWILAALLLLLAGVSGWFFFGEQADETTMQPEQMVEEIIIEQETTSPNTVKEEPESSPLENTTYSKNESITKETTTNEKVINEIVIKETNTNQYLVNERSDQSTTTKPSNTKPENIDIEQLQYRSLYEIARMEPEPIDPRTVAGMQEYLKKRSNIHFYTGAGAMVAMVYYPSTTDQFTWSADVALGLKLHDFYIESGVGYQKMQERGIYQIDFKTRDSIGYYNEVVSFEIDPQNPDEITYKTKKTTVYDSINHYEHKTPLFTYSYLNIPLKAGYRFYQKDHFSVAAEAGVIFSKMLSKHIPEPIINDPDYELIAITNQTPERVDVNFQWQVSLRLNYRFAKTISVAVQPVFTKYINSIYDTDAGYPNVKPYSMGLRFGIYFDF
jgi:hypothetical protein